MPETPTPTLRQALAAARQRGLDRVEAQTLLLLALGRPPSDAAWLLAHDEARLTPDAHQQLQTGIRRRLDGEPLAYITGYKAFYGITLQIDARVLDPRADTETLVDWALAVLPAQAPIRVLDLGTGSGAIALALQQQRPQWQVHALERSDAALALARSNAQRLDLPVRFHQGNWLQNLSGQFDAIVANPPYIAAADPHLQALRHEPLAALHSGADGLDDLRCIVAQAPAHLGDGGWLLLEHGYDQAGAVQRLLQDSGFHDVGSRHDLAGTARCSGGRWRATPPPGPQDSGRQQAE